MILGFGRQAPLDLSTHNKSRGIDNEADDLEHLVHQQIAELERSISALEEETQRANEKAERDRKVADARKRWSMFVRLVKGAGGISLLNEEADGALVVRIVTYLPPGERRETWPSQKGMHSVSHMLKIWLDHSTGELSEAEIHPEGVYIDDIVEENRGQRNIVTFVESIRHRVKVSKRRLALMREAVKTGLKIEYMSPIMKVTLHSGDVIMLEASNDWPLPASTLRLISISALETPGNPSRCTPEGHLVALMNSVNRRSNVERAELVPLVNFIESRLARLFEGRSQT